MLKKIFGSINMTWPKVLILAVALGVYTALMALWVPEHNSFHDIAVTTEGWVLPAVFIMTNCKTPLDSALKTFVFFLISQPLVYLIQVPFAEMGWGLFGYYKYWFIATLLTFPAAFIGWYITKDHIAAGLILSPVLVMNILLGAGYVNTLRGEFPHHLLSAIYCFGFIPVFIIGVLRNRNARILSAAVSVIACIVILVKTFAFPSILVSSNILFDDEEKYSIDETWSAQAADESISKAWIEKRIDGEYSLMMEFYSHDTNKVTLTDGKGNTYVIDMTLDEDNRIVHDE